MFLCDQSSQCNPVKFQCFPPKPGELNSGYHIVFDAGEYVIGVAKRLSYSSDFTLIW